MKIASLEEHTSKRNANSLHGAESKTRFGTLCASKEQSQIQIGGQPKGKEASVSDKRSSQISIVYDL